MAPKGKTVAERVIVLETIAENTNIVLDTLLKKIESVEAKIDLQTKVNEIHTIVASGNQPKSALQKFGDNARNVRDIILGLAMIITFLAIILKVDFTALIK